MSSVWLGYNLIVHYNQAIFFIDRRGHYDSYLSLGSRKSCNEICIDFGRSKNDGIGVNQSRTIRSISPYITSTRQGRFDIFDSIRGRLHITNRRTEGYFAAKSENENLGGNNIFENSKPENNFEVGKVGRGNSVIWNHKYS